MIIGVAASLWLVLAGSDLRAATRTWTGLGGGFGQWTISSNWSDNQVPVSGDSIVFSGSLQPFNLNDLPLEQIHNGYIQDFTYAANSTAFTTTGNTLAIGGTLSTITNLSNQNQTLGINVQMNSVGSGGQQSTRFVIDGSGDLTISGSAIGWGTVSLTGTTSGRLVIPGVMTGAGGSWLGGLSVGGSTSAGNLWVTGSVNTVDLRVTGTNGTPSVTVDGGYLYANNFLDVGGNQRTAGFIVDPSIYPGNGSLSVINGGTVAVQGWFTVGGSGSNGQVATMLVDGPGSVLAGGTGGDRVWLGFAGQMSGTISNGAVATIGRDFQNSTNYVAATGTSNLSVISGGTLTFYGATYFGGGSNFSGDYSGGVATIVVDGTGSTMNLGNAQSSKYLGYFGQASLTVRNGGNANFSGPLVLGNTNSSVGVVTLEGGTVSATSMTVGGGVGASGTVNFGTGGSLTGAYTGTITSGSGTGRVNFNSTSNQATAAVLAGSSLAVFQIGTGTTTLSGANTFGGDVTINAGALNAGSATALGSGGTITFGGGDLQYSASNQVDYSSRLSSAAGQQYRIDTNGQSVTFASNLTSSGGSLTKLGSGTLTVNGTNSYSGGSIVAAGTLKGTTRGLQGAIANDSIVEFAQAFSGTYAGILSGTGGVVKSDTGLVSLTANNAYAGSTSIVAGLLAIDGDQSAATGLTTVGASGTLGGTGIIGGSVVVNGVHAPGNSPGVQTINGDLTYGGGSSVLWELVANTTGGSGNFDQIVLPNGNLTFSGATALDLSFNGAGSAVDWSNVFWSVNRSWLLQDLSAGVTTGIGNFSVSTVDWIDSTSTPLSTSRNGATFSVGLTGQDVVLNYLAPVPEPSGIAIVTGGALAMAWFGRWRSRRRIAS